MDDHAIVALYWARDERALTETAAKFGAYCRKIAMNLLASLPDAEEVENDTWLAAWDSMPENRPARLAPYLGRITRNLALDRLDQAAAQKRGGGQVDLALEELAECIPYETDVEDQLLAEALGETVRQFVAALPPREADVFARRYFFAEPVKDIAQSYGLRPNHVSVLLRRTREKLKEYLLEEGWLDEPTGSL